MEGRLGDELLPPSSSKPGLVMNKPAVVVLAFVARACRLRSWRFATHWRVQAARLFARFV
jgi:hypothetical protein